MSFRAISLFFEDIFFPLFEQHCHCLIALQTLLVLWKVALELISPCYFFFLRQTAFGHNECPDPGIPLNARRFGDNFQLGSSISVICEDGFIKTQGAETVTCELDSGKVMWSGPIPKCEGNYPGSSTERHAIGGTITTISLCPYAKEVSVCQPLRGRL